MDINNSNNGILDTTLATSPLTAGLYWGGKALDFLANKNNITVQGTQPIVNNISQVPTISTVDTTNIPTGSANQGTTTPFTSTISNANPNNTTIQNQALQSLAQQGLDVDTMAKYLMNTGGTIDSNNSDISNFINKSIEYQDMARNASNQAVENKFNRESDYTLQNLESQKQAALEQSIGGGGISPYALQKMNVDIEKSVRDLESRKQEAISANDAASYKTISDLQLRQLELQQNAKEQIFNRVLGIANYSAKKTDITQAILNNIRNMSNDDLEREKAKANLELQQASSATDQWYKQSYLDILANRTNQNSNIKVPGWAKQEDANTSVPSMMSDKMNIISKATKDGISDAELYKNILSKAEEMDNMLVRSGRAVPGVGYSTYDVVNSPSGPLIKTTSGYLHSDGSYTQGLDNNSPVVQQPDANSQTYNQNKQGLYGGATDYLKQIGNLDNTYNQYNKAIDSQQSKSIDSTMKEMSFSQPNALLETILGWTAKNAYASDGSDISSSEDNSFFTNLLDSLNNAVSSKITASNAPTLESIRANRNANPNDYHPLIQAIAHNEGWFAPENNKPQMNNNPGNLKFAGQPGAIGRDEKGFAVFANSKQGWDALDRQLKAAVNGTSTNYTPNMTLVDFAKKYAPSKDNNNPIKYATDLATRIGVPINTKLKDII